MSALVPFPLGLIGFLILNLLGGTCGKVEDDQYVCDMDGGSLRGELIKIKCSVSSTVQFSAVQC